MRSGRRASGGFCVKRTRLRSACASVRVLPARTPFDFSLASPFSTTTSLTPSLYAPSGRPAAMMLSVMATTFLGVLHLISIRTVPGWRCLPSQMASQKQSLVSAAPMREGRCWWKRIMPLNVCVTALAPREKASMLVS